MYTMAGVGNASKQGHSFNKISVETKKSPS